MTTNQKVPFAPGDMITIVSSGFTVLGALRYRGEVITLSADDIEESKDREGNSWLALSETDQIEKYGEVKFESGDTSADKEWWQGDSTSTQLAANRDYVAASEIADTAERRVRWGEIQAKYGVGPSWVLG